MEFKISVLDIYTESSQGKFSFFFMGLGHDDGGVDILFRRRFSVFFVPFYVYILCNFRPSLQTVKIILHERRLAFRTPSETELSLYSRYKRFINFFPQLLSRWSRTKIKLVRPNTSLEVFENRRDPK